MRTLFFDTALSRLTVGVADGDAILASISEDRAKGHADRLVPAIREVMQRTGTSFPDLDTIGCTVGPGTFTGVRTGVAAARALGLAASLPLVGVTTLLSLAACSPDGNPVIAAIDAGRDELYLQCFGPKATPLGKPVRIPVVEVRQSTPATPDEEPTLVGSGAALVREVLGRGRIVADGEAPRPEALARVVETRAAEVRRSAGTNDKEHLRPLYLRPPDATPPERWRRPPAVRT